MWHSLVTRLVTYWILLAPAESYVLISMSGQVRHNRILRNFKLDTLACHWSFCLKMWVHLKTVIASRSLLQVFESLKCKLLQSFVFTSLNCNYLSISESAIIISTHYDYFVIYPELFFKTDSFRSGCERNSVCLHLFSVIIVIRDQLHLQEATFSYNNSCSWL